MQPFGTSPNLFLGCDRLGSVLSPLGMSQAVRFVSTAHKAGITHFDTADIYGQGDSERILSQALRLNTSIGRASAIIATKGGQYFSTKQKLLTLLKPAIRLAANVPAIRQRIAKERGGTLPRNFSKDYIALAVISSLRRLRTDYLDIFYLHGPTDEAFVDDDLFDFLDGLESAGKIRTWGVSCDTAHSVELALAQPRVKLIQADISHLPSPLGAGDKTLVVRRLSMTDSFRKGNIGQSFREASTIPNAKGVIVGTTNLEHMWRNVRAFKEATS
jgi:aryl-alcohol dehydrogenase-like predicted oxidoreductase